MPPGRLSGQFTPPRLRKTIVYPAFDGVIDWHGASIDPMRKLLIANANYPPFTSGRPLGGIGCRSRIRTRIGD